MAVTEYEPGATTTFGHQHVSAGFGAGMVVAVPATTGLESGAPPQPTKMQDAAAGDGAGAMSAAKSHPPEHSAVCTFWARAFCAENITMQKRKTREAAKKPGLPICRISARMVRTQLRRM
jgi:hypothetical protein